jgi:dTDP-4-amino-4,6-dideoxygalactose transaminase
MNVNFVDLKAQYNIIKEEIDVAVKDVIDNTAFIMGPRLKNFEENFAKAHGVKYCLGTSSGTDSLHLALWVLGIGIGDEVIVPVNTFFATAEAVSLCGATPVFVDNDPISYNIDVNKIEESITPLTKAIIPVHLYGQSVDMNQIQSISKKHNLFIVEDCAQSHLEKYNDKPTGSIGDIGCFSFYAGKNLGAYGEGGAVTTNNEELYNKMAIIRDHGSSKKYHHDVIGHNYRLEGIQAAILNVKLKYLNEWNEKRRKNATLYAEYLIDVNQVVTPVISNFAEHVFHLYVIRAKKRDELMAYLQDNNIYCGLHYPIPLHMQKAYLGLGYNKGDFPIAEQYANEIISLPMYPELPEEHIKYVCEKIRAFYN